MFDFTDRKTSHDEDPPLTTEVACDTRRLHLDIDKLEDPDEFLDGDSLPNPVESQRRMDRNDRLEKSWYSLQPKRTYSIERVIIDDLADIDTDSLD